MTRLYVLKHSQARQIVQKAMKYNEAMPPLCPRMDKQTTIASAAATGGGLLQNWTNQVFGLRDNLAVIAGNTQVETHLSEDKVMECYRQLAHVRHVLQFLAGQANMNPAMTLIRRDLLEAKIAEYLEMMKNILSEVFDIIAVVRANSATKATLLKYNAKIPKRIEGLRRALDWLRLYPENVLRDLRGDWENAKDDIRENPMCCT
jgi:hypothetical protein